MPFLTSSEPVQGRGVAPEPPSGHPQSYRDLGAFAYRFQQPHRVLVSEETMGESVPAMSSERLRYERQGPPLPLVSPSRLIAERPVRFSEPIRPTAHMGSFLAARHVGGRIVEVR